MRLGDKGHVSALKENNPWYQDNNFLSNLMFWLKSTDSK